MENFSREYKIHIEGIICWLPPHRLGKPRFPPSKIFIAVARFVSYLDEPMYEAIINYSPSPVYPNIESCFRVRLHFRCLDGNDEEISRMIHNSEIIILDAFHIIATVRNLSKPEVPGGLITDIW